MNGALVTPEILEPVCRQFRVPNRVRDVPVPQVMLDRPRVLAVVDELIAGGVAEHVRVDRKAQTCRFPGPRHELPYGRGRHAPVPLAGEHEPRGLTIRLQPAQRLCFWPAQRVSAVHAVLQPPDVEQPQAQVHLFPAEGAKLGIARSLGR